jgi:hypothetical protein
MLTGDGRIKLKFYVFGSMTEQAGEGIYLQKRGIHVIRSRMKVEIDRGLDQSVLCSGADSRLQPPVSGCVMRKEFQT